MGHNTRCVVPTRRSRSFPTFCISACSRCPNPPLLVEQRLGGPEQPHRRKTLPCGLCSRRSSRVVVMMGGIFCRSGGSPRSPYPRRCKSPAGPYGRSPALVSRPPPTGHPPWAAPSKPGPTPMGGFSGTESTPLPHAPGSLHANVPHPPATVGKVRHPHTPERRKGNLAADVSEDRRDPPPGALSTPPRRRPAAHSPSPALPRPDAAPAVGGAKQRRLHTALCGGRARMRRPADGVADDAVGNGGAAADAYAPKSFP